MNPGIRDAESPQREPDELAVAVLAPIGRDAELACAMLRDAQLEPAPCGSPQRLFERIAAGCGAALVAAEALDGVEAARLMVLLDAQPEWSAPSLIIFLSRDGLPRHLRALAQRPNTTLLHRPATRITLVSAVRVAVESRRWQYALRDLLKSLQQRTRQLQRLTLELTEAEERERRRLAQTLHDDLQQILAGANFRLGLLALCPTAQSAGETVGEVSELLLQAMAVSRELSHELSPPGLVHGGLGAALKWLAGRMKRLHGLSVPVYADPEAEPPTHTLKVFMYRCAQEMLFNVAKHSNARRATVRLSPTPRGAEIVVRDRGRGFDADKIPAGFGLIGIGERADILGGKLEIVSNPGKGTTVTLTLPWRAVDAPPAQAQNV